MRSTTYVAKRPKIPVAIFPAKEYCARGDSPERLSNVTHIAFGTWVAREGLDGKVVNSSRLVHFHVRCCSCSPFPRRGYHVR